MSLFQLFFWENSKSTTVWQSKNVTVVHFEMYIDNIHYQELVKNQFNFSQDIHYMKRKNNGFIYAGSINRMSVINIKNRIATFELVILNNPMQICYQCANIRNVVLSSKYDLIEALPNMTLIGSFENIVTKHIYCW